MGCTAKLDGYGAKLDHYGKTGWIALVVLGFLVWWPLGLATLAYMIGSGRVGGKLGRIGRWAKDNANENGWFSSRHSSGNRAFDEYRQETLRRLEEEQREFKDFLERLRMARDKAEFDQFMAERRGRQAPEGSASAA